MSSTGIIQAATVIAKTTQTQMGNELQLENTELLVLFLDYVKGDETGVDVILNLRRTTGGQAFPNSVWTEASGVNTRTTEKIRLTASGHYAFSWFYLGVDFAYFTQGGSNNDGTPTGTLAASFTAS